MKAASISLFGGPEVVTFHNAGPRQAGADEAVVRVEAASVNPLDLKIIAGYMQPVFPVELPYIPGTDFSGVVSSVGDQVTHLKPGDRVFGRSSPSAGGAFAWQLIVAAADLCVIPSTMSFEQAAALPTAFGTARQALFEVGQLKRGERVLIHAGAGGVGSMAVQLAHMAGAHVIATASARNIELVKSLGADEVIDYRSQDFTTLSDIDLVLDILGGSTLENSWSVLGMSGRIATLVEFDIESREGHVGQAVFFASATPFLQEAVRQFSAGQLQVITDSIFALDETRAALEKVATGHACGKVIIRTSH
ncbi:NADP-dependent oxidoreductase [Pseudomonas frederiksbergensis]|uniref:Narbonolide/10-deoxymethynolide synthase PikA2, modules 3 and 4 n=1 Tax=Pseudomonas frederiksbergensis TaxID=104087 RepID=A0A6L5C410_9PSED|nr:NADP-dependent oxidoreductase [Pseudomonas frederiksbergensis]KAF2394284.1 Narbonolide/10-deoxymethynolide synthase PikA2, modules 3 and 4 [Pseudomonas frederiksbergensis]